jgi:NADH-quinone oxidoreductase subunit L
MFHLMTHAFFKALLFLAAGIVIHALAGEQDMRNMGGLRKLMPVTYVAFLIGGLALAGIPPFAGFFSKDSILAASLDHGWYGDVLFAAGEVGALLTGIYTFRMIFRVFGGEQSDYVKAHPPHHPRELALRISMSWTVGALAVLSIVGGFLQFSPVWHPLTDWLQPVAPALAEATNRQEALASALAVGLGVLGIVVAWWLYSARLRRAPRSWRVLEKKFYFDELYDALFYRPAVASAKLLYALVEGPLVNGSVAGVVGTFRELGLGARRFQTGLVRMYALTIAIALVALAVVYLGVR